ncbi:zinc-dependent alcohol dehydrogenase [Alicyclobacillus dauci]|uniref:Zinc-binding dehydrogenase n=1 Tax=Alicyclobacillus dauci TaxID=1475485 RepID=A0ABY6Z7G7_9BACL|nr:zinc-binding dehydrogenase [Alicyclobacillus dauci]WAH37955.1 zinc-binding dehydrogenase [Alicyclobacillus dauci]
MKALRKVTSGKGTLQLEEMAKPTPQHGNVLLKVKAAGICGTDIHIMQDEFPHQVPVTLGHEVAGEIVKLGPGVHSWSVGDKVITESYFSVCGQCEYCRGGRPNLCTDRRSIGSAVDGGMAEFVEVPAVNLHKIPDHVSWTAAALTEPLACTVHALNQVRIQPGEWVVISGPGPMGLLALQVARAAGGKVIMLGITQDAERLKAAQKLGASSVINVEATDYEAVVSQIVEMTEGGAPVVLECSGAGPSASLLFDVVRKRGRYGQIGLYGKSIPVNMDMVCYKELVVTGTNASIPSAWTRALTLLEDGAVTDEAVVSGVWSLENWEDAFKTVIAKGALKVMLGETSK